MNIKVKKDPVVTARIKVIEFEKIFKKTFDLKKSVMENLEVVSCTLDKKEVKIKEYLYMATDWGDIFRKYDLIVDEYITLKMHRCIISDVVKYIPGQIDGKDGTFTMKTETVSREDFLIVMSFNPRVDKHIEYMLSQSLIDYANFEWKLLLTFD